MTAQQELGLFAKPKRTLKKAKLAGKMMRQMKGRHRGSEGMKRAEFAAFCGMSGRDCRHGREASHSRIIATGSGYVIGADATRDQLWEAYRKFDTAEKAAARGRLGLLKRYPHVLFEDREAGR